MDKRKIKIPTRTNIKGTDYKWVVTIVFWTFIIAVTLSLISSSVLEDVPVFIAFLLLLAFILLGVVFDMIGIAVTSANESPFHSMASHGVRGAKQALKLVRNAEKVSNFCNDVVGDISGIMSGSITGIIVLHLTADGSILYSVLLAGLVSALTVGGKAIGKAFAITNSNQIIYTVSILIHSFSMLKSRDK